MVGANGKGESEEILKLHENLQSTTTKKKQKNPKKKTTPLRQTKIITTSSTEKILMTRTQINNPADPIQTLKRPRF
jgi:hypothetical protein